MPARIPQEQRDAIAADLRAGATNRDLETRYGVVEKTIRRIRSEYGIVRAVRTGPAPGRPRTQIVTQGQRFGRLEVVDPAVTGVRSASARCRCDCGAVKVLRTCNLLAGNTNSCGCLHREAAAERGRSEASRKRLAEMSRSRTTEATG